MEIPKVLAVESPAFKRLQKLYLWPVSIASGGTVYASLTTFMSHYPTLKILNLYSRKENWIFKLNIPKVVGNSCMELEELIVNMGSMYVRFLQPLEAIKSLKILKLCDVLCEDLKCMSAVTQLRELHFIDCRLPKDYNQFDSLTQLTKLRIIYRLTCGSKSFNVVEKVRRLINLKNLTVRCSWSRIPILDEMDE